MHRLETVVRHARFSVRDTSRMRAADPRGVRVIRAIEYLVAGVREQLAEGLLNRREIGIMIKVLFLNIQDDRVLRMIPNNRPVTLVRFSHEPFARRVPLGVYSENWDLRADVMGRVQSSGPK